MLPPLVLGLVEAIHQVCTHWIVLKFIWSLNSLSVIMTGRSLVDPELILKNLSIKTMKVRSDPKRFPSKLKFTLHIHQPKSPFHSLVVSYRWLHIPSQIDFAFTVKIRISFLRSRHSYQQHDDVHFVLHLTFCIRHKLNHSKFSSCFGDVVAGSRNEKTQRHWIEKRLRNLHFAEWFSGEKPPLTCAAIVFTLMSI